MPKNNGTNTYERVTQMAFAATQTDGKATYDWDDVNIYESMELAAAQALADHWMGGSYGPNHENDTARWLEQNGHAEIAADIKAGR